MQAALLAQDLLLLLLDLREQGLVGQDLAAEESGTEMAHLVQRQAAHAGRDTVELLPRDAGAALTGLQDLQDLSLSRKPSCSISPWGWCLPVPIQRDDEPCWICYQVRGRGSGCTRWDGWITILRGL